jgi:folate-binding protein YgfZ
MFSIDQYDAAHRSAVMFDRSADGKVVLTGADRRTFLHALLTNDIIGLNEGTGTYAAYLTPQGRMITDMRVIETGDRILVGVAGDVAPALASRFETLIFSEDVQVEDATAGLDQIGVHGPAAADLLERATNVPVSGLANPYSNVTSSGLTIVRDDALGQPGFDVYASKSEGLALRSRLAAAGAVQGSVETYEILRIESGRPLFGVDMTTDTIPLEAGIENRAVSFAKGCYVGQEVIVRVMHRGHGRVARRLVRLVLPGAPVPSRGARIFDGSRDVGEITSAAESPRANAPLAFAYVHRDYVSPGTVLTVNGSQARVYEPVD